MEADIEPAPGVDIAVAAADDEGARGGAAEARPQNASTMAADEAKSTAVSFMRFEIRRGVKT